MNRKKGGKIPVKEPCEKCGLMHPAGIVNCDLVKKMKAKAEKVIRQQEKEGEENE